MLLDYDVYLKSLQDLDLCKVRIINTINPHSYCESKKDEIFAKALKESDILLPDGIGIVWAENLLNNNKIKKIAGFDLFKYVMQKLNEENGSCFFLGSSQNILQQIKDTAEIEFPNVKVYSFSPPYKSEFSFSDSMEMCDAVNTVQPDILFVGMTAPKQEKWVHNFKDELKVRNICSVGAVFDFYAGKIQRSSPFWINLGLEWFPRLLKEPKRLFKRNFVSTPKFILEVLSFKLFGKGIL